MQKTSYVNPQMLTTPLGAALGWALARRVYGEQAVGKQLAGAGLGGGAGYIVGDLAKAAPLAFNRPQEGADAKSKVLSTLKNMIDQGGKVEWSPGLLRTMEQAGWDVTPKGGYAAPEGSYKRRLAELTTPFVDQDVQRRGHRVAQQGLESLGKTIPGGKQYTGAAAAQGALAKGKRLGASQYGSTLFQALRDTLIGND